jgi:hypothetical protein
VPVVVLVVRFVVERRIKRAGSAGLVTQSVDKRSQNTGKAEKSIAAPARWRLSDPLTAPPYPPFTLIADRPPAVTRL